MARYRRFKRRTGGGMRRGLVRQPRVKKLVDGTTGSTVDKMIRYGASVPTVIGGLVKSVNLIKSMINVEPHYIDAQNTQAPDATNGVILLLSGVAQGDDDTDRQGNKILLESIYYKLYLHKHTTVPETMLRCMFIVDKECDGALPSIADILDSISTIAPMNKDFSKRFAVLRTWNVPLNTNNPNKYIEGYSKLNFHASYDGATNGIASCKENQIYFVALSDQPTYFPTVYENHRIKFYDN